MAYQRLQVSEGLAVIPSDTVPIPDPATKVMSSAATSTTADKLVDTGGTFTTRGIQKNAIVYNTTDTTCAFVTAVDDANTLSLSADIMASGENYTIFNAPTKGATLYVGTGAGSIVVEMASERDSQATPTLTFYNVPDSAFLPLLVTKVGASTEVSNIIALW